MKLLSLIIVIVVIVLLSGCSKPEPVDKHTLVVKDANGATVKEFTNVITCNISTDGKTLFIDTGGDPDKYEVIYQMATGYSIEDVNKK